MRTLIERIGVTLAILAVFVAPVLVVYLAFACGLQQGNPGEWDDFTKFLAAVISIIFVYAVFGILQDNFN